jgi:type IX secretion system substrate protein
MGWENYVVFYNGQEYWGHFGTDLGLYSNMYNSITYGTGVIVFVNTEFEPASILLHISDVFASTFSSAALPDLNCSYSPYPCERSETYWKNNSSEWALNSIPMKIGTKHYYATQQTLDILNRPDNGDASVVLARALVAAKFNVAQGSELSPIVSTINAAMKLIGDKRIPFDVPVSFTSSQGMEMLASAAKLNLYNAGSLNTTSCLGTPAITSSNTSKEVNNNAANSLKAYPNPVTNSATILFCLSQSEKVSIQIFDLSGRLVKTLVYNECQQGTHQIIWDTNGNAVSSGIYFVTLISKDYSETKKISVIK